MRNKIFILFALFAMALVSCGRGNQEIDELRERMDAIEKRIDGLDSDVERLNALILQITGGGYVTAVVPDRQEDETVGYILAFNDGSNVYINVTKAMSSSGVTFVSVDTSNPDCVEITLSDGTVLSLPTWAAFDALQQQVKQLNINLAALSRIVSALQDNDYLVSTTPFVEDGVPKGWLLNFSKSGLVVIYSSGGSESPQIGVRQDTDGVYYWTLGGEWLLDSKGGKVRAQGADGTDAVTPQIKIEEGYWWISYDDGTSWSQLGNATGKDGDSFFREVDTSSEEYVRLVLADGGTVCIPKYVPLDICLSFPSEMVMGKLEDWCVPYIITGTFHDDVSLAVFTQDDLSASVEDESHIRLWSTHGNGGRLIVMLSVPSGTPVMKTFQIEPRSLNVAGSASASQAGELLYIHYASNTSFDLDLIELPWVSVVQGYSGPESDIILEIKSNGENSRSGRLFFTFDDPAWDGSKEYGYGDVPSRYYVEINQEGAGKGGIMPETLECVPQGKVYEIEVQSDAESLTARPGESCSWISCTMERKSLQLWLLRLAVEDCKDASGREAMVYVSDDRNDIGSMLVRQKDISIDEGRMIKMCVVALPENDYTVVLPFTGTLSMRVDWGDGCVSVIERENNKEKPFRHKYADTGIAERYIISGTGTLQKMSSSGVSEFVTVESVLQWGANLGLDSMSGAFHNVKTLRSVAEDKYGAFSQVTIFTSAFQSCTSLEDVPVNLFDSAFQATHFDKTFAQVDNVTTESPYVVVNGMKVHLYERNDCGSYWRITSYTGCFSGGNWADKEAISLAGWN